MHCSWHVWNLGKVHLDSWRQTSHSNVMTRSGLWLLRRQWREHQSAAMAVMIMVRWMKGKPGEGSKNMKTLVGVRMSEDHTAMHAASHCWNALWMPLLQPGSTTDSFVTNGEALSETPILCQPTTLFCSNPEKGVKTQRGVDRGVKKTQETAARRQKRAGKKEKKRSLLGEWHLESLTAVFHLFKVAKWAAVRARSKSEQLQCDILSQWHRLQIALWALWGLYMLMV